MRRGRTWSIVLGALLLAAIGTRAQAEVVGMADGKVRQQWVRHHLVETEQRKNSQAELQVWSCYGGLLRNGRAGRPLVVADQEHKRGLLTHAPTKLVVQLDSPARTFSAVVGIDSNEQTQPGLGSVVFSVTVGGKVVAQSPVLREGMKGVPRNGSMTRYRRPTRSASTFSPRQYPPAKSAISSKTATAARGCW